MDGHIVFLSPVGSISKLMDFGGTRWKSLRIFNLGGEQSSGKSIKSVIRI